jgi:hypothetical protein
MGDPMKTFKVQCAQCQQTFQVRFPLADAGPQEGPATYDKEVVCLYCRQSVMVSIPSEYHTHATLLRSTRNS